MSELAEELWMGWIVRRPDGGNAWDALGKYAGTVEGPEDWSEEHDHYLYGVSKKIDGV